MCDFSFRPIARSDFALLSLWLREPHVARWWCDDPMLETIEADYGPVIDGKEPAEVFIAQLQGRPFGLLQRFPMKGYPEYLDELATVMPMPPAAWSIDYLIGRQVDAGQGHGTRMLQAFVQALWQDQPGAHCIVVPVHAHNRASWRVLERIGFARVASGELEPDNPADPPDHHIYQANRPA